MADTGPKNQTASTPPAPGLTPFVTVAICTHNRSLFLEKAVRSVLPQLTRDSELLIVDNASTDETPDVANRFASTDGRIRVCAERELGLSVARNRALSTARGEFVVFLDDDATAEPGWLAAYRTFFFALPDEKIACVAGAVFAEMETPPPGWLKPHSQVLNWSNTPQRYREQDSPWGCNFALRREPALKTGGFTSRLGHKGKSLGAYEESELSNRLKQAGYAIWWLPSAGIKHFVAAERLTLKWQVRSQFNQGRSSALMRLGAMPGRGRRACFALARLLVAPFHCGLNALLVVVSFPLQRGRIAAHALMRCARILGFSRQLIVETTGLFGAR